MYTLALIHLLGELQDSVLDFVGVGDVEIMGRQQGRREKCCIVNAKTNVYS